jgi:hypothetical protein
MRPSAAGAGAPRCRHAAHTRGPDRTVSIPPPTPSPYLPRRRPKPRPTPRRRRWPPRPGPLPVCGPVSFFLRCASSAAIDGEAREAVDFLRPVPRKFSCKTISRSWPSSSNRTTHNVITYYQGFNLTTNALLCISFDHYFDQCLGQRFQVIPRLRPQFPLHPPCPCLLSLLPPLQRLHDAYIQRKKYPSLRLNLNSRDYSHDKNEFHTGIVPDSYKILI